MQRPLRLHRPSCLHCRRARVPEALIDIAVLASGSGTNLQALIDSPVIRPHIAAVLSDKAEARALHRARQADIAHEVVAWGDYPDRDAFSVALAERAESHGAKGIVLAGFMRILSATFVDRFPGRVLNIHPSLLPSFPGAHAVEAALDHGVKVTGVTVHVVNEKVDNGPIVAQAPVEIFSNDTFETLHARIQVEEHRIYPEVVTALVEGRLIVDDGKVVVR